MPFIHGAFYHKINTGNDGDDSKDDGGIDPILYAVRFLQLFFIPAILLNYRMNPVGHNDEHDENGGGQYEEYGWHFFLASLREINPNVENCLH
jgi:hypothetical protein